MSTATAAKPEIITFTEAFSRALHDAMEMDPTVIMLGEDIADEEGGGIFKVTKGLSTKFGGHRVKTTPISEQAIVGAAIGASLAGMRPVAEIMLMNFITVPMDQIVNHAAKLRFMSGGQTHQLAYLRSQNDVKYEFLHAYHRRHPRSLHDRLVERFVARRRHSVSARPSAMPQPMSVNRTTPAMTSIFLGLPIGLSGRNAGSTRRLKNTLAMGPRSLFAPALAARLRDQRAINTVVALMTGGGFALSIFGPLDLVWVWAGLLGLGQGSLTAVALTMIMLRTRDGHTAAHLSGMMQGVGYGLGSTGTLMVGQLHQSTGSFTAAGKTYDRTTSATVTGTSLSGVVGGDVVGLFELTGLAAKASPLGHEGTVGRELLDAVVASVKNVDIAGRIEADVEHRLVGHARKAEGQLRGLARDTGVAVTYGLRREHLAPR